MLVRKSAINSLHGTMKFTFAVSCLAAATVYSIVPNVANAAACVRPAHLSPDAPNVDIAITPPSGSDIVLTDIPFATIGEYSSLDPASYDFQIFPTGSDTSVMDFSVSAADNIAYTVAVVGELANDSLQQIVFVDDNTPPSPGKARVRFIHTAPDAPTVDITLTDGTTLFDDISYKSASNYLDVAADTYTLQVRDETGTTIVLTLDNVMVEAGNVYTVYATGLLSGTPALGATLSVDAPNDCTQPNYQTIYFDPAQSGQAVQIVQNGERVEGAWYVYDGNGEPIWYTFTGDLSGNVLNVDLLQWTGPAFGTPWDIDLVSGSSAGTATLTFSEVTRSATFDYAVGAVTGTLNLEPYVPVIE